jgi:hypothetical protein
MKLFLQVAVLGSLSVLTACGGGTSAPPVNPGPTPAVTAISPNSSTQSGPPFTLSVVGSNFTTNSTVHWNGATQTTTFVNANLLTAAIPAGEVATPGPDNVTVVDTGGSSNALSFAVPCVIPTQGGSSQQTRARLGAYYFDGWSGPLTNFHFQGLPLGPFQDRQPLSGWQDNSQCAVEQQLAVAHNFGIDFFVFDWYFNSTVNEPGDDLNSALDITHQLADRHGMKYAILYVNSPPFVVAPADWPIAINQWIGYMSDPAYVTVNGKALLILIDMGNMRQTFGSSAGVASALNQLRTAAVASGLPGVYVIGGFQSGYDHNTQTGSFPDLSSAVADGYDAVSLYNYSFGTATGQQSFSLVSEAGQWIWSQAASNSPLPFVPVAMDGWDPRPWNEGNVWFSRSPQDVATFVDASINWANANPALRLEPSPTPPLVIMEAWNEFGEGSHLLPTVGEGTAYGDAVAAILGTH